MKIGTLTFHRNQNYGALLQSYALQKILKNLGHEAEIIDYYFPGSNEFLYGQRLSSCKTVKSKIRFFSDKVILSIGYAKEATELRTQRTVDFIKKYLPTSKDSYKNYDALKKHACTYDVYICGSDQVWNPNYHAADKAFRLEFVPERCKRISYAASFGVSSLPEDQIASYREALQRFDRISVREKEGVQIVKNVADKEAELVLDPTLLLSQDDWLKLASPENKNEEYIFFYFLGDRGDAKNFVFDLQKKYNMPIYSIGYHPSNFFNSKMQFIVDAGPLEFLRLIAGASFVVTNSFHGTVFSILFKKSFYSFVDTNVGRKMLSSRICNITDLFNLRQRVYNPGINIDTQTINYNEVEIILSREREKSINFLKKSLMI